ncbi:MAG: hypothetical protein A3B10_04470 [Candidatus Doudnabacteria bacterium RIFCSPLOWO2_01_FULL_44_21]|uniref:Uncharacterized protein n=1 Tax=Candidatus Doudnabacteria bacterium RIFCSPLOWO2_01_FULL_44_21 TaxID=1817841 RepID=A0A1F5PXT6_9BACT|nr:MAG: hypothetical protein A3B95_01445 [Candidatus Doudnabacteria bacterium RIFCSPHIGHO2_02_FULL_43_13b]OGE94735.1 MAG: hypothetical protein A3B10_04470 [Candidatus Doudnabacteria bacterium RIFCSPLOWO2_01_FULL_44_21]
MCEPDKFCFLTWQLCHGCTKPISTVEGITRQGGIVIDKLGFMYCGQACADLQLQARKVHHPDIAAYAKEHNLTALEAYRVIEEKALEAVLKLRGMQVAGSPH